MNYLALIGSIYKTDELFMIILKRSLAPHQVLFSWLPHSGYIPLYAHTLPLTTAGLIVFCSYPYQIIFSLLALITLAGTPTTVTPSSTSCITTAPAPILTLSPIVIPPIMIAPAPI